MKGHLRLVPRPWNSSMIPGTRHPSGEITSPSGLSLNPERNADRQLPGELSQNGVRPGNGDIRAVSNGQPGEAGKAMGRSSGFLHRHKTNNKRAEWFDERKN
ncbi:predicted protein [Coccidioides posadasii str. Silveira]|uniref:Predicted protein n=1 Tax=Coccidioides posadasii (strain RMSCC 757 / Silveira) TaxID=443226 RepID=E9D5J2_COCPS|nr:predicted protein [Coccidioides posadasii str. Silveira]